MLKKMMFMVFAVLAFSCSDDDGNMPALDPNTAPEVAIDRFSAEAGNLFVRDASNGLPESNEAIDFDTNPAFITKGLGPSGEVVEYYNFDVQPTAPAPIYALFRENESTPVSGQLNIIDAIPGEAGYNDFWLVHMVTVPSDYVANTLTSESDIINSGYAINQTTIIVNCPVVPKGSSASKRYTAAEETGLIRGWYKDQVVYYFSFVEKDLASQGGAVPLSDIYVSFNINPDQAGGGPGSGFKNETDMAFGQTHNVVETIPEDGGYSPLWLVNVYDNAEFDQIDDLTSAESSTILGAGVAMVNCPVVSVE